MKTRAKFVSALTLFATLSLTAIGCSGGASDDAAETDDACVPANDVQTIEEGYLTVAYFSNPPFSDADGDKLAGAEGEILSKIAERECLEIKLQQGNVPSMIPAVETGRADTTLGSWYRTQERSEIVLLSDPVITVYLAIVSENGSGIEQIDDLQGHTVGSAIGSLWIDDVNALIGDDQKLYDTLEASYADLKAGRIEAILNSEPTAVRQIELAGIEDQVSIHIPDPNPLVQATLQPGQTNFPVSLTNTGLNAAINDGLKALRESGDFDKILEKYGISASANVPEPLQEF